MNEHGSIEIGVDQLLELRHIPTPTAQSTPASNSAWLGAFRSNKRGHGTDYDDLRFYSPGDDIRHIDWRASARTGELHTRLYREEKEHRTHVICDLRHCMFTGSTALRANRAAILCARLLWQACRGGSRVMLVVITPAGLCMSASGSGHTSAINGCSLLAAEHQRIAQELKVHYAGQRKQWPHRSDSSDALPSQSGVSTDMSLTDTHSRRQTLEHIDKAHGPTLDSVQQYLLALREHNTTQLWVSGFDYEGTGFFEALGKSNSGRVNVAIQVDDPMLSNSLPAGEFHYRSHKTISSNPAIGMRSTLVHRNNQRILEERLKQIQQTRATRFDALMIPYLSTAEGYDEVITALRHQAYLV